MLCARRANHRRLRISATKEQHVLRLKKLDIDYILSVSDEMDRHPLVTRPQRRRPGQMLGGSHMRDSARDFFSSQLLFITAMTDRIYSETFLCK